MLLYVGFDAEAHAILLKGLLGEMNVFRFDFGRLAGAPGPPQSLVVRHQLLDGRPVLGDEGVAPVESVGRREMGQTETRPGRDGEMALRTELLARCSIGGICYCENQLWSVFFH